MPPEPTTALERLTSSELERDRASEDGQLMRWLLRHLRHIASRRPQAGSKIGEAVTHVLKLERPDAQLPPRALRAYYLRAAVRFLFQSLREKSFDVLLASSSVIEGEEASDGRAASPEDEVSLHRAFDEARALVLAAHPSVCSCCTGRRLTGCRAQRWRKRPPTPGGCRRARCTCISPRPGWPSSAR